jgi:type IV secretory pathway VirB9-like protein
MKLIRLVVPFALSILCGMVIAGPAAAVKHKCTGPCPDAAKSVSSNVVSSDAELGARVVSYDDKDVVKVKTKLRFTTLLVLPKNEQILDFLCGDKEYWAVNGVQNFASVKPAKAGSQTNLNLITASGNIYSFELTEVSESPGSAPDIKVFIQPKDESMITAASGAPRFVSVQVAEDYRRQIEMAKEETRQTKQATQVAIDSGVSRFLSNVRFPYRFEAGKKPFFVRAMYHDDKFSYIQARPEETPTLYEVKDGKPNLINFDYRDGVYVVPKILDRGYLAIGKQKLGFTRE